MCLYLEFLKENLRAMNQGLFYIKIQVLESQSLHYLTFGSRQNCKSRMQLLKSETVWSAWGWGP